MVFFWEKRPRLLREIAEMVNINYMTLYHRMHHKKKPKTLQEAVAMG
jgi:hypothetical protein